MFVDTSLLVRELQPEHPLCAIAKNAIGSLRLKDRLHYVVLQNLVELWVVAMRPAGENGLGMFFAEAVAELARVKGFFALLPETEELFPAWERLVTTYQVSQASPQLGGLNLEMYFIVLKKQGQKRFQFVGPCLFHQVQFRGLGRGTSAVNSAATGS